LVIVGHLLFAYAQWFRWPRVCKKLTSLTDTEIENTRFLGRSIASYNASIGVGLFLSLFLENQTERLVQLAVLAFIALTAMVGNSGARGNLILFARLLPAALAFLLLAYQAFAS